MDSHLLKIHRQRSSQECLIWVALENSPNSQRKMKGRLNKSLINCVQNIPYTQMPSRLTGKRSIRNPTCSIRAAIQRRNELCSYATSANTTTHSEGRNKTRPKLTSHMNGLKRSPKSPRICRSVLRKWSLNPIIASASSQRRPRKESDCKIKYGLASPLSQGQDPNIMNLTLVITNCRR